jgi:uncharacterized phosphatase
LRLLAIRHGVTSWNSSQRWQGTTDIPLANEGHAQAVAAGSRLRGLGWHGRHVFCSKLSRSVVTADTICTQLGLERAISLRSLNERELGEWEGLSVSEVEQGYPGSIAAWTAGAIFGPPGGETDEAVAKRFLRGCAEIMEVARSEKHPILVVTHAGVLHAVDKMNGSSFAKYGPLCGRWIEFKSASHGGSVVLGGLVDLLSDEGLTPDGSEAFQELK